MLSPYGSRAFCGIERKATLAHTGLSYQLENGTEPCGAFVAAYFDLTLMQWVMYDSLGVMPAQLVQAVGGHQPEIPVPGDPMKGADGRRRGMASLRLLRKIWGIEKTLAAVTTRRAATLSRIVSLDLTRETAARLNDAIRSTQPEQ